MTISTRSLLAGVALVPIVSAAFATAASAQAARDFSIAAGPMDGALVAYARQADVQLLYTAELVAGLQTPGVSGRHAPDAALDRLLTGTGVTWSRSRPGVVVLRRAAAGQPLSIGAMAVCVAGNRGSQRPHPHGYGGTTVRQISSHGLRGGGSGV